MQFQSEGVPETEIEYLQRQRAYELDQSCQDMEAITAERDRLKELNGELLNALKIGEAYILDVVNEKGGIDECDIDYRIDLEKTRAAIAKATQGNMT